MRHHLLAKQTDSVQHFVVLRRPDGAQQKDFVDAQGFVPLEKPDARRRGTDAKRRAALPHLPLMGPFRSMLLTS